MYMDRVTQHGQDFSSSQLDLSIQCNLSQNPSKLFCGYGQTESKVYMERTSLVAQWLRICLPMQGTQVRALVREDPTYHGATKPVRHNY